VPRTAGGGGVLVVPRTAGGGGVLVVPRTADVLCVVIAVVSYTL